MFRLGAVLVALAACSFDPRDATPTTITLTDDSEQELANHVQLADGVVTPWGTIEPSAFVVGGLRARAYAGDQVDDDDDFEAVVSKATTALGTSYRQVPTDWGSAARPKGLGLASSDNFTVLFEGEILLQTGQQRLEIDVDDRAVAQVALDGKTFGERLFARVGTDSIFLDVRRTDWYPIRIAFGETTGEARLKLTIVQGQIRTPVAGTQLRARLSDDDRGLVAFGFDGQALNASRGETVVPTIDAAFGGATPPYDLDMGFDRFSVRHAGQLRVEVAGTYAFRAEVGNDAFDGFRLFVDGTLVASKWLGLPDLPSGTIDLAAGWHDVVLDYSEDVGNAEVRLVMSGPDIAEAAIDPARLRPAVARGLVAQFAPRQAVPIADAATTEQMLRPFGPGGGVIESVDHGFGIANHRFTDLAVSLVDCGAAPRPLAIGTSNPFVPSYFYFPNDTTCAGSELAPSTPWKYQFVDTAVGNDGMVGPAFFDPILVASYRGGERAPFATAVTYISQPRETPGAIGFGAIRALGEDRGARIELAVRTGADEDELVNSPWIVVGNGEVPSVEPKALVQYQISIAGDGWQYPSIDKVELEYLVYP